MRTFQILLSEQQIQKIVEGLSLLPDDPVLETEDGNTSNPSDLKELFEDTLKTNLPKDVLHSFVL